MSKPPAPVAFQGRGGAASVRSSQRGGKGSDVGNVVAFESIADVGLDVCGDDGMEKEVWVMIRNQKVTQHPDGRRCNTCPFRDNT